MTNFNFLFSNSVQGESDLTRYCPRDAFEMPLTCPRHLFCKMLILSMLLMVIGVGNVLGATVTYTHDFTKTISSGDNTLSTITWTASSLTNVGDYNSSNYKGVQIGTSSKAGAITLTSKNNWGAQTGTSFYGYTKVKKVYVWMNSGGSGTVSATVTIGGKSATSDGTTVSKNSSASSQRSGTTKVTYTPAADGKTGAIVITVTKGTASAAAGYLCAIQVECEEPDVSYNVDWYVGGTRTKQETGVSSGTPPSVADNALGGSCSSLKFLGWSETNIGSTPDDAPDDLFSSDDVPSLTGNKTFYAVFGEASYDTDGTPVKTQTHLYDTWTYSGTTTDKTSYRLFGNNAYVQTDAFDLSGLVKVTVYGGYFGDSGATGISIKDASGNNWKTGNVSGNSQTKANEFTGGSSLTGTKTLRIYSTSGNGSTTGVRISKVEIYTYPMEYSNCVTTCCTPLGTINGSINLIQRKQSEMDFHLVIISVFQRSHYLPFGHLPFGNFFFSVFTVTLFFLCTITRNKFPAHRTRNL